MTGTVVNRKKKKKKIKKSQQITKQKSSQTGSMNKTVASPVNRSGLNGALLRCGRTGDGMHEHAASKSAVLCDANMSNNLMNPQRKPAGNLISVILMLATPFTYDDVNAFI